MDASVVPAWKKLGLQVKETPKEVKDTKETKEKKDGNETNKLKRHLETNDDTSKEETKQKKPPKRPKLPKSERKPPPEADQLVYLRLYTQDKKQWKFSKSKQNWIIRHVYDTNVIPPSYHEYLINYLEGVQGGIRARIVESSEKIINEWNTFMSEKDDSEKEDEKDEKEKETTEEKPKKPKKKVPVKVPPTEEAARLAQKVAKKLGGIETKLELVDDNSE